MSFSLIPDLLLPGYGDLTPQMLAERGIRPDYAAGLSLGEYSALACAGVFTGKAAVELAAYRGAAMAKSAEGV